MTAPVCVGLHITKCAGTSLMTTLRRVLSEDEYYFFSSYHEGWLASRPLFADIVARERLRIVFGHYCHETLLSVFSGRPVFLFTGLREPLACAISGYRQVNAVRAQAGREPQSAAEYLETHADPICAEILRCFPSVASRRGATWHRARAALSLFDFVYATEQFDAHAASLFAVLDIPSAPMASDNVSAARPLAPEFAAFVKNGCREIHARDREFLGEDMRLWEAMQPHMGHPWMRAHFASEPWALDRDAFAASLPPREAALDAFCARERDFMLHEFDELGRLPALRASLATRIANAQAVLARLD